ncbi:alpha/beta fold hydrolase [Crystallibacter degradans]|uniref:alpha/beta fold hydrolase n=1 Tax=Crystallibacter degradans TaxID=2726743 RepID=UPI001472CBBD|nr:alpha/beta fold hydrolase [Arthrobacter sp. SF27]NMR32331.1 alpha/beta fold hydrolase [Arthrobacter sp. SF27]
MEEERRTVIRPGATLAVYSYGPAPAPGIPTILFVHGYPDDHTLFEYAVPALSTDCRVITYDTRNAGASRTTSKKLDYYRLPALVDDLFAVINAAGAGPVHLVGHDWGSIQGWAAIQDPRAKERILSFTSISGPDLGHLRRWFKQRLRRPLLWPQALGQMLRSSYVAFFQLPVLPELLWRKFLTARFEKFAGRGIGDNGVRGLALYRANSFRRQQLSGRCSVRVQVVVPRRDPFLSPRLVDGVQEWVPQLEVVEVDAGHWWPPEHIRSFVQHLRNWIAATGTSPQ